MISPEAQTLLIIILATISMLALILAGISFLRLKAMQRQLTMSEAQLQASEENYLGLSLGAQGQSRRLLELEQDQARLRARLDALASSGDGSGSAFSQAIRMARKGSTAREIMEICGLGEIEADLVVLMHKEAADRNH